jgi:hypothetical protein
MDPDITCDRLVEKFKLYWYMIKKVKAQNPYWIWVLEGWRWIVLFVYVGVFLLILLFEPTKNNLKYFGFGLQVLGFFYAMLDIYDIFKECKIKNAFSRLNDWIRRCPIWYEISQSCQQKSESLTMTVHDPVVHVSADRDASFEMRLDKLESDFFEMKEFIGKNLNDISGLISGIRTKTDICFSDHNQSIHSIKLKIDKSSDRSFYSAEIGVVCFFLGTIFTALP